jgi:hypothetical protein
MDLILTWPKTRPLDSYLRELTLAQERGEVINFRVSGQPNVKGGRRCYMVHDGAMRGWLPIVEVVYRGPREVRRVVSDARSGFWPEGWFVVRKPRWTPLAEPVKMQGFQGFRYLMKRP